MMKFMRLILSLLIVMMVVLPAAAHEGREVGEYSVVFGWRVEPAYAGIYNGPELIITHHESGEPLAGAEDGLQLEVSFGDQTRTLDLYPVFGEPGRYTADLIPSRAGDYSFHLTGTLGDVAVDETFTSTDGEFSPVEPAADIVFPEVEDDLQAQIVILQAQLDALQEQIDALTTQ